MRHSFQVRAVPAPGEAGRNVSIDASELPLPLEEEMCIAVRRRVIEAMMLQKLSNVLSPIGGVVTVFGLSMVPSHGFEANIAPIGAGVGTVGAGFAGTYLTVRHLKYYANHHPWETAVTFHEASDSFEQGSGDCGAVRIQRFQIFLESVRPGIRRSIGWLFARFTKSSEAMQLLNELHTTCQTWCKPLQEVEDNLKGIARKKIAEREEQQHQRVVASRRRIRLLRAENKKQTEQITDLRAGLDRLSDDNAALRQTIEMILERNQALERGEVCVGNGEVQ